MYINFLLSQEEIPLWWILKIRQSLLMDTADRFKITLIKRQ
jgi:hypothetical protein